MIEQANSHVSGMCCDEPANECCSLDSLQQKCKSGALVQMLLSADAAFGRLASSFAALPRLRAPRRKQPAAKHQRHAAQPPAPEQLKPHHACATPHPSQEPSQPACHEIEPVTHCTCLPHKKQSVSPHALALQHPRATAEPLQQVEAGPCSESAAGEATALSLQQQNEALQELLARQEHELQEQQLLIKEASEKLLALKYYKTKFREAEGRAEGALQKRRSMEKQHKKELAASRHSTHLAVLKVLDLERKLQALEAQHAPQQAS